MPERRRVLERLAARIVARTGLHYYADKMDLLDMILARRMEACSCVRPMDYLSLLSDPQDGAAEWRALESAVTIGETFFFRYAEQFHALETTILPDLLRRLRPLRTLRIWSVGCSNGAEPYSLAILLRRLLKEREEQDWTIEILGTDISTQALERARQAEYGAWSLRDIGRAERTRWFGPSATGRDWVLRPEYRRMVRFEYGNIMDLAHGGGPAGPFDLILCRNVLIYFETAQALDLIRHLSDRLSPRGWLLLGHSDPIAECDGFLDTVTFPGTLAFRTRDSRAGPAPPPSRRGAADKAAYPAMPRASAAAAPRPAGAPRKTTAAPPEPRGAAARVCALADSGAVEAALALCRAEIRHRPLDADLHFLSGMLSAGLDERAGAEAGFRRAVYLCRDHVMAHVHLAHLLRDAGRVDEACRILRQARVLAGRLPQDLLLPQGGGLTAGGLLRLIGEDGVDDLPDIPPSDGSDRARPDDRRLLLRGVS
ncbi:CheR family methyltransferase [Gluconacetobacter tumulisoli]|uniref:protein-glutamate O-methyltransferase n=1 Tax=Gluconacetobacter tumulisoli TaxID=1286189 RepID=A0A7W4PJG4_9PROT|nr:protein-glutamate O-methyltransferase CheR [Gluconacetobacter tumulisoli]MBB2200302.1 protein-glutamate O-methyltransferase CheR [Gluconacetobacter tumulisoli]